MDAFQKIVLVVATIILITLLIIVGMLLSRDNKNKNFPPNALVCPDYWKEVGENVCQPDYNKNTNIGDWNKPTRDHNDNPNPIDDNGKVYFGTDSNPTSGTKYDDTYSVFERVDNQSKIYKDNIILTGTETCKKKKWANHWNIKWDGITNYNSC
tara:strand:- start:21119 stop:21580 length:462 start_codon:yes stop_codon:yes gene_type:complete